jgi:hypothetical protein
MSSVSQQFAWLERQLRNHLYDTALHRKFQLQEEPKISAGGRRGFDTVFAEKPMFVCRTVTDREAIHKGRP